MAAYDVTIAEVPLNLKSPLDEKTVKELVSLVDEKIKESLPLTKTGSIQVAAILASLNLAEELMELKQKARIELDQLEKRVNKLALSSEPSRLPRVGKELG